MSHKLTDNVNESFEFEIHEHKYQMRYPTTEEAEKLQDLAQKAKSLDAEKKDDEAKATLKAATDYLYTFIAPVTENAPNIEGLLKKQSIVVSRHFNEMIKAEFSGQ